MIEARAPRRVGSTSTSRSRPVRWFVAVVAGCAALVLVGLGARPWPDEVGPVACLVAIGLLAGAVSVRLPRLATSFAPTEPFVLVGLCISGAWAAVMIALAAVVGPLLRGRLRFVQVVFNVATAIASAGAASFAFLGSGGVPGADPSIQMLPVFIAAGVFFVLNGSMVAAVVALEKHRSLLLMLRSVMIRLAPASAVAPALAMALVFALDGALLWSASMAAFVFAVTSMLFAIGVTGSASAPDERPAAPAISRDDLPPRR